MKNKTKTIAQYFLVSFVIGTFFGLFGGALMGCTTDACLCTDGGTCACEISDGGNGIPNGLDTETEQLTDSDALGCADAMACLLNGDDVANCILNLDPTGQQLLLDLAFCLGVQQCITSDDLMTCALENCKTQLQDCTGDI